MNQQQEPLSGETSTQVLDSNPPSYSSVFGEGNNSAPPLPPQQDVAINVDARFGQSCQPVLSEAQIVNNIIEASKRADCQRWLYLLIGCAPSLVIMSILWIIYGALNCTDDFWNDCSTANFAYYSAIGFAVLTGVILIWVLYHGATYYSNAHDYALLQSNVRYVIRLEGDTWTRYVNYLYGPENGGFQYFGAIGAMTFCCCRKPHYEKLIARGYGYIVLCKHGFILDEMRCIVRNKPHIILAVNYVPGMGLRLYVLRKDAKYMVRRDWSQEQRNQAARAALHQQTVPLDIYLPNRIHPNAAALLGLQIQYGL